MCKSAEQYMKYDQCLLKPNPGKSLAGQISSHLSPQPNIQHHLKTKFIYLCSTAKGRPDQSPCSIIQDFVSGAVLEEPAYSAFSGPCPACDAAQIATNRVVIFNNCDSPPAGSGTGEERVADATQSASKSSKKKEKVHKSGSKKKSKK